MAYEESSLVISDASVERNRTSRTWVDILLAISTLLIPALILGAISKDLIGWKTPGGILGVFAGWRILKELLPRMRGSVRLNHAFLTVDAIKTLLRFKDPYTLYGPGDHFTHVTEQRDERNNISLDEATQSFNVTVNTKTGPVLGEGSFRLRPRFEKEALIAFIGGVASIPGDIEDLIKAALTAEMTPLTVDEALERTDTMNTMLHQKFGMGDPNSKDPAVSALEKRFGIVMGDVTLAALRLTPDAEKTRAGIDEAVVVAKGTAVILGFVDETKANGKTVTAEQKMRNALARGKLTQDQIDKARDRFMAVSDNIKMTLDTNEYTLRLDADPDVVSTLAALGPTLLPLLQQLSRRGKGGGGNQKKGGK